MTTSIGSLLGHGTARKPHSDFAGYRAELRNPVSGGHTIILDCKRAADQGAPLVDDWIEEGGRYQVLCNAHSIIVNCSSLPLARSAMKDPCSFCETCREIEAGHPELVEMNRMREVWQLWLDGRPYGQGRRYRKEAPVWAMADRRAKVRPEWAGRMEIVKLAPDGSVLEKIKYEETQR